MRKFFFKFFSPWLRLAELSGGVRSPVSNRCDAVQAGGTCGCVSKNGAALGVGEEDAPEAGCGSTVEIERPGTPRRASDVIYKPWGWCIETNRTEEAREVLCRGAQGYCSRHYHENLANHFLVVRGIIDVIFERDGEEQIRRLTKGESILIFPQEWHRFIVVSPGYFVETYYQGTVKTLWDDIVRSDEGSSEDWKP